MNALAFNQNLFVRADLRWIFSDSCDITEQIYYAVKLVQIYTDIYPKRWAWQSQVDIALVYALVARERSEKPAKEECIVFTA